MTTHVTTRPDRQDWDVIVIGAGPAGSALAATLARFGWRVLLVERLTSASFKLGETLPPASVELVRHFVGTVDSDAPGFPDLFRTAGNLSIWAREQADVSDFFFTSTGFGLCVDRAAFDEALRSRTRAAGATLIRGVRFDACARIDDRSWRIGLASTNGTERHRARYLADCSGRGATVATALGVETLLEDRQFAFARWYEGDAADDDRYTRIEAAPQGWWYTNRLPGAPGRRLVVWQTDSDLRAASTAARSEGFDAMLKETTHVGPLLEDRGYRPRGKIRGAPAGSQRLRSFCGDGWIAVGDAAQAHDPLSSQGMDKALRTASHAGHMIHYALCESPQGTGPDGSHPCIRQYDEQQRRLWDAHVSRRKLVYRAQPRWSDQPFWRRRRTSPLRSADCVGIDAVADEPTE